MAFGLNAEGAISIKNTACVSRACASDSYYARTIGREERARTEFIVIGNNICQCDGTTITMCIKTGISRNISNVHYH